MPITSTPPTSAPLTYADFRDLDYNPLAAAWMVTTSKVPLAVWFLVAFALGFVIHAVIF